MFQGVKDIRPNIFHIFLPVRDIDPYYDNFFKRVASLLKVKYCHADRLKTFKGPLNLWNQ